MITSVITGATAIETKSLKKNLEAIPGKHSVDSLQKTAVLATPHAIRKVLQSETWGSPLYQEKKYQEEKAWDNINNNNNNNNTEWLML
jgi:hypothetical protein